MKNLMWVFGIFLVFGCELSLAEAPATEGPQKWYYPNGKLKAEAEYKGGQLNGWMKQYEEDGTIKAEAFYMAGELQIAKYYGRGKLSREVYVRDGQRKIDKSYYENGQLKQEIPWDGLAREFYEDGKIKIERKCVQGVLDWQLKQFYENGQLQLKWDDDKKSWLYYGDDGTLLGVYEAKDGVLDGRSRYFFHDGTEKGVALYKQGKVVEVKIYYHGGKTREEAFAEDGIAKSTKRYYESGSINRICEATDLKAQLYACKDYYETGELAGEDNVRGTVNDGNLKFYYPAGALLGECHMKDGQLAEPCVCYSETGGLAEGKVEVFSKNKQLLMEGEAHAGLMEGEVKSYYESSKLARVRQFKKGYTEGIIKSYFESGMLKSEAAFEAGVLHGEYKEFFEDGTILYQQIYEHGKLVSPQTAVPSATLPAKSSNGQQSTPDNKIADSKI